VTGGPPLRDRPVRVATLGAALSGNKGAASMLHTVLDVLPGHVGPTEVAVLTTYPDADGALLDRDNVRIVSLRPAELVFPVLPLLLLAWLLRRLGGSPRWAARHPAVRALVGADVVVDLAGVSFVDGRGIPILGYNVLMTGVGLLSGTPVVKCAQALGPFEGRLNRIAARFVLPRVDTVVARGDRTRSHLEDLGLRNADEAADLAFLLPIAPTEVETARRVLETAGVGDRYLTVVPSAVVQGYAAKRGIAYPALLAEACDRIARETGHDVVVLAHSARPGAPPSRMNDLPLVEEIGAAATDARVIAVAQELEPGVLRSIIGGGAACMTSRFHAMVSALAETTPVLVVGWSHKYGEVLRDVDLEPWAMTYDELDLDHLVTRVHDLLAQAEDVRRTLTRTLPGVRGRAERNFAAIERALQRGRAAGR
jgi:colanic acid/amylovoran biosynthesis protein